VSSLGGILGAAGLGGTIGQAIVKLELDTGKYQGELAAAESKTVASTRSMGSGVARFGALAQAGFAAAAIAVVAFGASAVRAAIEANEAHTKLANTFQNNAMLADQSVASFEAMADSLRNLTGVDDEAIQGAQALLGQFNLTGRQVQELIPLVVDLSAKIGVDLDAAAKAVGKSATGTTAGLKRYGIQVDEVAAQTDAFSATLDALGKVEGFAAQRADAEPWRLLGAQWEELEERAGRGLLPILQKIADAFLGTQLTIQEAMSSGELWILQFTADLVEQSKALKEMDAKAQLAAAGITNLTGGMELGGAAQEAFAASTAEANAKLREEGQKIADVTGVLSDLSDQTKVTASDVLTAFRKQANALSQYGDNWQAFLNRNPPQALVDELRDMGLDGAQIVAQLAGTTDKKFDQIVAAFQRAQREARNTASAVGDIKAQIDKLPQNVYIDFFLRGHGQPALPPGTSVNVGGGGGSNQQQGPGMPGQRNGAPRGWNGAAAADVIVAPVMLVDDFAQATLAVVARAARRSRRV